MSSYFISERWEMKRSRTIFDCLRVVLFLFFFLNPLYLKTILSQMICPPGPPLPPTTSGNFQSLHATSLHNEQSGFFSAALLQLKPVRMLDCSASASVSRLSDVKQLDGPSGHPRTRRSYPVWFAFEIWNPIFLAASSLMWRNGPVW